MADGRKVEGGAHQKIIFSVLGQASPLLLSFQGFSHFAGCDTPRGKEWALDGTELVDVIVEDGIGGTTAVGGKGRGVELVDGDEGNVQRLIVGMTFGGGTRGLKSRGSVICCLGYGTYRLGKRVEKT
jgi:hypothetical protein